MIRAEINQNYPFDNVDLPGNQILRLMVRKLPLSNFEKGSAIENCTWLNLVDEQLVRYEAKMERGGRDNNSPIAIDFNTDSLYTYCLLEATRDKHEN